MANLIEQAKQQIDTIVADALARAVETGSLPAGSELHGIVEIPKDVSNGDFAANHAMAGARAFRMAPRKIADSLIAAMSLEGTWFSQVEAAGPGFMNFRLAPKWYADVLGAIVSEGSDYCRTDTLAGKR